MKAIALTSPGTVEIIDYPEPVLGADEVLVRMTALGLCGSDLSVLDGITSVPSLPWVMGHEGGGEIVEVGSAVTDRFVGQTVVIEPNICCFECAACLRGQTSACPNRRILGINEPGIGREFVAIDARFAWPVPEDAGQPALACFEPSVVVSSAIRRSGVQSGQTALVIGAGSQGLLMCIALRDSGVAVDVIEPHLGRLELATRFGARPSAEVPQGYDLVFETSGAAPGLATAIVMTASGGTIVLIGNSKHKTEVTARELVSRQLRIIGSLIYDHPGDFRAAADRLSAGNASFTRVIEAEYGAASAPEAFANARRVAGKSWIDLSGWSDSGVERGRAIEAAQS